MIPQAAAIMERARLIRNLVLADVARATPAEMMTKPGNRYSARDVLVHVGNWEEEAVRWLPYMLRGEPVPEMAPESIDELNAQMLARYEHLDTTEAVAYIARVRGELVRLADAITPEQWQTSGDFHGVLVMCPDHEIDHLHQLREALASARGEMAGAAVHGMRYTRQRLLTRLNLEHLCAGALTWRPPDGKWTVKETLIHLAVWDRFAAGVFAAVAEGRPMPAYPYPAGGLDAWNKEQVDARSWMTLAEVLHDLGGARAELELQVRRLTPEHLERQVSQTWLGYRKHDQLHMNKILEKLKAWREATR